MNGINRPRHDWHCIDITLRGYEQRDDLPLRELVDYARDRGELFVLYAHSRHIMAGGRLGSAANDLSVLLKNMLGEAEYRPTLIDWSKNEPLRFHADALWLAMYSPESENAPLWRAGEIRQMLADPHSDRPIFMLASAGIWDILHNAASSSLLPADPRCRQFLLWDRGVFSDGEFQDSDAWCGAGWLGARCRDRQDDHALCTLDRIFPDLESGMSALVESTPYPGGHTLARGSTRAREYQIALASFLPPFRNESKDLIPTLPGQWGGVRRWGPINDLTQVERDLKIRSLTRHLMLDGWICPWRDPDGVYRYQPTSLALLCWVARALHKRHTETPQAFLDGYGWELSHWFGGYWPKARPITKSGATE